MYFATSDDYRAQLASLAQALARADISGVEQALAPGSHLEQVKLFTDGNLDKRFLKLSDQLEFLPTQFGERWEELLVRYVREVPLAAYDSGLSDGTRFLDWLPTVERLSAVQADYVTFQKARHTVEEVARCQRAALGRFYDTRAAWVATRRRFGSRSHALLRLNPVRVVCRLRTSALLDERAGPPQQVLLFPERGEIATAMLEPEGWDKLLELESLAPCTLNEWSLLSDGANRQEQVRFVRSLLSLGILAAEE